MRLNVFLFLIVTFCFFSCKNKVTRMVSSFVNVKDTVSKRLKQLPDSKLTRIQIDPYVFMFDTIRKGSLVTGKFKIKNIGHKPFTFSQLITFCDCTSAEPDRKTIPPQDSNFLSFILDTDSFQEGYNERAITVLGNFRPYFRTLKIEGFIKN